MLLTRLLKSATFRLTLTYLGIFSLSAMALLAFLYESSVNFMEQQTRETIDAEIKGFEEQFLQRGLRGLKEVVSFRADPERNRGGVYLLVDHNGRRIAGNLTRWPEAVSENEDGTIRFTFTREGPDGQLERRQALARAFVVQGRFRLLVGRDVEMRVAVQRLLTNTILLGGGLMIVLGVLGGFVLARATLSRLEGINRATKLIMQGELSRRIQLEGSEDEFDELAQNLNQMLDRIEELVRAMREVTDNIAHDLRTPLTRMRSRIEVALMGRLDAGQARELLEETMREADGLIQTFDALLAIARAQSGAVQAEWEEVDLAEIARDVHELYEPLAEDKEVSLALEADAPVRVRGHRQLIAQALANLVDNAVKYTPQGGRVWIRAQDGELALLEVRDNGPGIPPADRKRALERFVRLDPERSAPGNGLGLALVDAVARLHRARLTLDDNRPGLAVRIAFPKASRPRSKAARPGTAPRSDATAPAP